MVLNWTTYLMAIRFPFERKRMIFSSRELLSFNFDATLPFYSRSQLKKFLGSKVRRTVGKAKMMAQEVSLPGRQKEEMIDIPDELTGGEQHVKVKKKRHNLISTKSHLVDVNYL